MIDPAVVPRLAADVGEALARTGFEALAPDDRKQLAIATSTRVAQEHQLSVLNSSGRLLDDDEMAELTSALCDTVLGTAQLGPLLRQGHRYSDFHVNGADKVFAKERGSGRMVALDPIVGSEAELIDLVKKLIRAYAPGEPRFDAGSPAVDIQLPDGERVHAMRNVVDPPVVLAIRIPDFSLESLDDLVDNDTIEPEMARFLHAAVEARLNIIVAGGTGSGKTTLLRVLLNEVDPSERIVTIEDLRELHLARFPKRNPNIWSAESVKANVDGQGEVTVEYLLRESLRQDPDRIVVGEVRGREALEMFKAMSTGNEGSMCSVHARSAGNIVPRLIQCIPDREPDQVCIEIANSVDLFLHLTRSPNGPRITSILEVDDHLPETSGVVHTTKLWEGDGLGHPRLVGRPSAQRAAILADRGWWV
ncbi:MAG: ATPase, T2SS/T4P/T4SS family [Actinomycetota bacterium]